MFAEVTSHKIPEVLHSVLLLLLALMLAYIKMGFYKHLFAHLDGSCANKETGVSLAPRKCKQRKNGKKQVRLTEGSFSTAFLQHYNPMQMFVYLILGSSVR